MSMAASVCARAGSQGIAPFGRRLGGRLGGRAVLHHDIGVGVHGLLGGALGVGGLLGHLRDLLLGGGGRGDVHAKDAVAQGR